MAIVKERNGEPCSPFVLVSEKLYKTIFSRINEKVSRELALITRPLIDDLIKESEQYVNETKYAREEDRKITKPITFSPTGEEISFRLMILDIVRWKKYALVHANISLPLKGSDVYHYFFYKKLM